MQLDPGTIAYWRDFAPGQDKFVYLLGVSGEGEVLSFTISSQQKYLAFGKTKADMIEIPFRSTDFLTRASYIQCFYEVTRTPIAEFSRLEANGTITWRGRRPEFLPRVARIVQASVLLAEEDRDAIRKLIGRT